MVIRLIVGSREASELHRSAFGGGVSMIRGKIHAAAYLARRRGRDRRAVSPGFAVGVRLGAGIGVNEEDCKQIIAILERDRLIDYVNVSIGDYFRMDTIVGGMHHPTGYQLASSADIASVASVPRLVTGRFRTLDEVAQVLRDGKADLVSMVRAVIADPELVRKTRRGAPIKCDRIACNQGCVGGLLRNGRLGCTVNSAVGTDLDLAESLSAWKRLASPLSRATRSPWSRRNRDLAARYPLPEQHRRFIHWATSPIGWNREYFAWVSMFASAPIWRLPKCAPKTRMF